MLYQAIFAGMAIRQAKSEKDLLSIPLGISLGAFKLRLLIGTTLRNQIVETRTVRAIVRTRPAKSGTILNFRVFTTWKLRFDQKNKDPASSGIFEF